MKKSIDGIGLEWYPNMSGRIENRVGRELREAKQDKFNQKADAVLAVVAIVGFGIVCFMFWSAIFA